MSITCIEEVATARWCRSFQPPSSLTAENAALSSPLVLPVYLSIVVLSEPIYFGLCATALFFSKIEKKGIQLSDILPRIPQDCGMFVFPATS